MFHRRRPPVCLLVMITLFSVILPFTATGCSSDAAHPGGTPAALPGPANPPHAELVTPPPVEVGGAFNERPPGEVSNGRQTAVAPRLKTTDAKPRLAARWWLRRHERLKGKVASMAPAEILFVGDSITEDWAGTGIGTWRRRYAGRGLNLGVAGDRTQSILWRLQNGQLACAGSRWAVVLAGTNNLSDKDEDDDVAKGVAAIVHHLVDRCPSIRVIVMGILPREPVSYLGSIRRVNAQLEKLDNGGTIRFLDLGPRFLTSDGVPRRALLPDGLHLSAAAYEIWADALAPFLDADGKKD